MSTQPAITIAGAETPISRSRIASGYSEAICDLNSLCRAAAAMTDACTTKCCSSPSPCAGKCG